MAAIDWGLYPNYSDEYLRSLHTKQLLKMLHVPVEGSSWDDSIDWAPIISLRARLKAILATREHVPNKLEGKRKRQLAAKRKT